MAIQEDYITRVILKRIEVFKSKNYYYIIKM